MRDGRTCALACARSRGRVERASVSGLILMSVLFSSCGDYIGDDDRGTFGSVRRHCRWAATSRVSETLRPILRKLVDKIGQRRWYLP